MVKDILAAWLRPACGLFGVAGILVLAGCGGGSGAPNNPYLPPPPEILPLQLIPEAATIYPGVPFTLTISGGVPPYRIFSSDQLVLPVPSIVNGNTLPLVAGNVSTPTTVNIGVADARGIIGSDAEISVQASPLLPSGITVTGNPNPACPVTENTVCSGGTGTATVKVTGNGGLGVSGRLVRFDVVQGNFQFVSTNPAQPLVQTLTAATDSNGNAIVVLSVPPDTPTQTGVVRATDVTTGQQITGAFRIQQVTTDGEVLAVLPSGPVTITGPDSTHCSSGVSVSFYIFGGTPPYTVNTNFPQALVLSGVPVTRSGGSFTATTNGACFINATFVITDATGRTVTGPTVTNELGTGTAPPPQTPLIVTPGAIAKNNCVPANVFQFIGTGGITPYSAVVTSSTSPTTPVLTPQTGLAQGQAVNVSGLTSPSTTVITLFDNSSPRQSGTVTIDCTGSGTPPTPPVLLISPSNFNYQNNTCVGKTSTFTINGGTAPYTIFATSGQTGATITPTSVGASGGTFAVSGLTDTAQTTNLAVVDSGTPQLQTVVTINCPTTAAMQVNPAGYSYSATGTPTCSASNSTFTIVGGVPPYNISFSVPGTVGTITPTTVTASGGGFSVTGLSNNPTVTQLTIRDSSVTPQTAIRTITCNP